jgi:cytochrome c peroxidase
MEAPFGGKPGEAPSLTDAEIDDIVAFLQTLNDGTGSPPPVAPTAAPAR